MIFTYISVHVDPNSSSRIAAQLVTGVGFLGAGIILKTSHFLRAMFHIIIICIFIINRSVTTVIMMASLRKFYTKYRNILELNKNLIFSGTAAFFVSAAVTELYSKYNNNDFLDLNSFNSDRLLCFHTFFCASVLH
jgi:hypothetical protein